MAEPFLHLAEEERIRMMEKRRRVCLELVDTERTYVTALEGICHFKTELQRKGVASKGELDIMFGNATSLHNLHVSLLAELEEAMKANSQNPNLVKPLQGIIRLLVMYVPYAVGYELAQKTRLKLVTNPVFLEALESIEWKKQKGHNALKQILITPIQRNPRYRMYIEQLLKATPRDDPQHDDLRSALEEVQAVLYKIEESKKENSSREAIVALRDTLTGSFAPLHEPDIFVLKPTGKRHAFRKQEATPTPAAGAPETDDLTCCHYCRLTLKDCVFYVCPDCKWRVHDRCYSSAPPNCAGKQQNLVSIVKASRRLVEMYEPSQVACARWNDGSDPNAPMMEEFQTAKLYVFNDGVLICSGTAAPAGAAAAAAAAAPSQNLPSHVASAPAILDHGATFRRGAMSTVQLGALVEKNESKAKMDTSRASVPQVKTAAGAAAAAAAVEPVEAPSVELIDFCHYYSALRNEFATCVDIFAYGPLLLIKNPHTDASHVLMFQDAATKFQFLTVWTDCVMRWSHANSTIVTLAQEHTMSDYSLSVAIEKESHFMQVDYLVRISVPMKGQEGETIVKKQKDLAAFHASLARVFDQSVLPPLPDAKQISKQKDDGKLYASDVTAWLTAILVLPNVLELEEVDLFFGKIMPEIRMYAKSLRAAPKGGAASAADAEKNDEESRLQAKLDSPLFLIYFRKFLEREGKDSYLDFYMAIQDLRRLRGVDKIQARAKSIFERFDAWLMGIDKQMGESLKAAFAPNAHVLSYSSVFNAAYEHTRMVLSDLTQAFLMSPEFHEMTGDEGSAGDSDKILQLDMSNVVVHTQLCTIVNHPSLLPQFQEFCQARYVGEMFLAWRKIWELELALAHCRRALLVTEHQRARVLPAYEISLTELNANKETLEQRNSSGPLGLNFDMLDASAPQISLEELEEAFPPLPVVSQAPRQQVVALLRYFRHVRNVFVDTSSDTALSFSPETRVEVGKALDSLAVAPSLSLPDIDMPIKSLSSDLEILLTAHLLAFVKNVEQERIAKMEAALKNAGTVKMRAGGRKPSASPSGHARVSSTAPTPTSSQEEVALGGATSVRRGSVSDGVGPGAPTSPTIPAKEGKLLGVFTVRGRKTAGATTRK